jgi:hypothetical protein
MFNYRLNYRISSKTFRNKKNYEVNKLFLDFIKKRELNSSIILEETYYE